MPRSRKHPDPAELPPGTTTGSGVLFQRRSPHDDPRAGSRTPVRNAGCLHPPATAARASEGDGRPRCRTRFEKCSLAGTRHRSAPVHIESRALRSVMYRRQMVERNCRRPHRPARAQDCPVTVFRAPARPMTYRNERCKKAPATALSSPPSRSRGTRASLAIALPPGANCVHGRSGN